MMGEGFHVREVEHILARRFRIREHLILNLGFMVCTVYSLVSYLLFIIDYSFRLTNYAVFRFFLDRGLGFRVYRAAECREGRLGIANEYMGYAFDHEGSWGSKAYPVTRRGSELQGYLAHKKLLPPRTLQ